MGALLYVTHVLRENSALGCKEKNLFHMVKSNKIRVISLENIV